MLSAGFDLHRVRFPEAESVDRASRPGTAGIAMTIAHGLGRTRNFNFDGATKTASNMAHDFLLSWIVRSSIYRRSAIAIQFTNCTCVIDAAYSESLHTRVRGPILAAYGHGVVRGKYRENARAGRQDFPVQFLQRPDSFPEQRRSNPALPP